MWIRYGLGQGARSVSTAASALLLSALNRTRHPEIPAVGETVISLTSHGTRLRHVHLAIESVARGSARAPIVLWLDGPDYDAPWPAPLRRLVARGLQVRRSDGSYGPHTKYWGTFRCLAGTGRRVVTIDDDIIYPSWFLQRLLEAGAESPATVRAYRAHRIAMRAGELLPYRRWGQATTTLASPLHFATGVSGVLYPAALIDYVAAQGEEFLALSPRADDVWLHLCALRSGHLVRQVYSAPQNFPVLPATQLENLAVRNTFGGGNDRQIAVAYRAADIACLWEATSG
ncbi:MAG TPA: glycosyltransferase [Corynebacterium sp.]|nr:glycosyltransferase [Corynebacterium sp.]